MLSYTHGGCADPLDHNCNHAPGCLDLFVCITDPACQGKCKSPLDTGCVCPEGSGDTATCPKGWLIVHSGTVRSVYSTNNSYNGNPMQDGQLGPGIYPKRSP